MTIKYFDMFAGIGGFRSGLEAIGGFECVGYCEIDKYAKQAYEAIYDTGGELYFDDARKIVPEEVNFTLMTQEKLYPNSYPISTFLLEDFPVSPSQSPEQEKDLTIQEERCFLKLQELLPLKNLSISSSKMFPVCLIITQAGHLKQSSVRGPRKAISFLGRGGTA